MEVTPHPKPITKPKAAKARLKWESDRRREERLSKETRAAYADVFCRSNGRCEMDPSLPADEVHHRRRRSQGGKHTVDNMLHLSVKWHRQAHASPDWSFRHGIILEMGGVDMDPVLGHPASCPVDHRPTRKEGA